MFCFCLRISLINGLMYRQITRVTRYAYKYDTKTRLLIMDHRLTAFFLSFPEPRDSKRILGSASKLLRTDFKREMMNRPVDGVADQSECLP